MPLVTDNIFQARALYSALEVRAVNAEQNVAVLRDAVSSLAAARQDVAGKTSLMGEYVSSQAAANSQLLADQAGQVSPDLPLDQFIASIGLAVALGEASMADRTISAVQVTAQGYLSLGAAADGAPRTVGFRLHQPELGAPVALATAQFSIAKTSGSPGAPMPRNLYPLLQEKQALFSDPFWSRFLAGQPPGRPAAQIVAEIGKILAAVNVWTMPFLVAGVVTIGGYESELAGAIGSAAPAERVAAFAAVAGAMVNLAKSLDPAVRGSYVAGDVYALATAVDATTRMAAALRA